MGEFLGDNQNGGATPGAGQALFGFDNTDKGLFWVKDENGLYVARRKNASIAALTVNAANTYITDSDLKIPSFGFLQARSRFLWKISASKTGAGVAQPIYTIVIGANRSTADVVKLTLTGPAQTAIADIGTLIIMATIRSIGAAGVLQATAWWEHRGTAASSTIGTGFANDGTGHVETTSAGFDMTALTGQFIGLCANSGASGVWTVTQVHAEVDW